MELFKEPDVLAGMRFAPDAPLPAVIQDGAFSGSDPADFVARARLDRTATLRNLHRITSEPTFDFADKIRGILALGLDAFGLDIAIVSRIEGPSYRVEHVLSRLEPIPPGTTFELTETYCAEVVADDTPRLFHFVAQSELRTHPCYRNTGLEAYIGASLNVNGKRFGTLNFSSPTPRAPFTAAEVDLLCLMTRWLGYELTRAHHEAALVDARKRAEEASLIKDAFVATVSHELRTSMNGVLGVAQLLACGQLNAEQKRDVATILSAGRAMVNVLNDLLDVSSIDAGRLRVSEEPFAVQTVVQSCCDELAPIASEKGLSLQVDTGEVDDLWLLGDGGRVRQILLNLVSNAIKYTDTGDIRVTAGWQQTERGATLALAVQDSGIGIAAEEQARLFEPYTRGDSERVRMRAGHGLGLSICRQLCHRMGGRISLESEAGRGSTFHAELPMRPVAPPVGALSAEPASDPAVARLQLDLTVLLAEDDIVSQKTTARMLGRLGCAVTTVNNGVQAVAQVQAACTAGRAIDVVLMDGRMPVMDGYAAARAIRALPGEEANTPIVALTAGTLVEEDEEWQSCGTDRVVHKPLDLALLAETLQSVITRLG